MGSQITLLNRSNCYIHKEDFKDLLISIQKEVARPKWAGYGWTSTVLNASSLDEVLSAFGIRVESAYSNYYRFTFDVIYNSDFLESLASIAAHHVTNGFVIINDESSDIIVEFNDGQMNLQREEE